MRNARAPRVIPFLQDLLVSYRLTWKSSGCSIAMTVSTAECKLNGESDSDGLSGCSRMKFKSEDFEAGALIPPRFTCDGEDIPPELHWEDIPEGARSLGLSMTDPDALGGAFIHWLVHDIPKGVRRIERGGLPAGARKVRNDFGREGYGGPCPPSGTHRYCFKLMHLTSRTSKGLSPRPTSSKLQRSMASHQRN